MNMCFHFSCTIQGLLDMSNIGFLELSTLGQNIQVHISIFIAILSTKKKVLSYVEGSLSSEILSQLDINVQIRI